MGAFLCIIARNGTAYIEPFPPPIYVWGFPVKAVYSWKNFLRISYSVYDLKLAVMSIWHGYCAHVYQYICYVLRL